MAVSEASVAGGLSPGPEFSGSAKTLVELVFHFIRSRRGNIQATLACFLVLEAQTDIMVSQTLSTGIHPLICKVDLPLLHQLVAACFPG